MVLTAFDAGASKAGDWFAIFERGRATTTRGWGLSFSSHKTTTATTRTAATTTATLT